MSFNMITNTVHCKVSFDGQIRRFALDCTEFTSLKGTIARLLSLNNEFVLKYLDDESDYVTLSNKEDLKTALIVSPTLLRILVEKNDAPSTTSDDCLSKKHHKRQHKYHEGKDHHGHHGHYGHHGHHGHKGHGPHGHHGHHGGHKGYGQDKHPQSDEERNVRIQKKLAWINQCLADFGSDDSLLPPHALGKKQRLLKKKQRIEAFQRGDCHQQKKRQSLLTPEEEQKNRALKVQILSVKMDVAKLKARTREIKMLLQDKVGDKPLMDELVALKEKKKLLCTQKRALVDQMHI
jgi:hypothetical protein